MRRSFVGAAILLVGAAITLLYGLRTLPLVSDKTIGGMTAILGIAAYISAKHRRVYSCRYPWLRMALEIALLIAVFVPRIPWTLYWVASGRPEVAGWAIHAQTTILIPLVTLGAYAWATSSKAAPEPV